MAFIKDKRRVAFVRKISGTYQVIGKPLKLTASQKTVRLSVGKNSQTYEINMGIPTFRQRMIWYYFVDIEKGQIAFEKIDTTKSNELLDTFVSRRTIEQLVAGIEKPQFMAYLVYILLTLGMGIPLGYIIGNLIPM